MFVLIVLICSIVYSQEYLDRDYYLVDSLDLSELTINEEELINSLLSKYHKETSDFKRLELINTLIEDSWNDKLWLSYNQWMHNYTKKKLGKFVEDYQSELIGNSEKIYLKYYANTINNEGYFYNDIGDFSKSLECAYKALSIREVISDSIGLSESYNNIAVLYSSYGDLSKSVDYLKKSLHIAEAIQDKKLICVSLLNIGGEYYRADDNDKAILYLNKSLAIGKENDYKVYVSTVLNRLGAVYISKKDFDKGITYCKEGSEISEEIGDKVEQMYSFKEITRAYLEKGNTKKAKVYANKVKILLEKSEHKTINLELSLLKSKIHEAEKKWKKAYEEHLLYVKRQDEYGDDDIEKKVIKQKAIFDIKKKQQEIELLMFKNEVQELKLNRAKRFDVFLMIAFFLSIIIGLLFFWGYRKKQQVNLLLKKQNKEISEKNESKRAILQEIHHRVKNNLQVVNSLLSLQSSKVNDEKVVGMFKETQSRVRSMAKLHEKMYKTGDFKDLNTKLYIPELIKEIVKSYSVAKKIDLNFSIEEVYLDAKKMLPLGLIINEVITNSLKYAFDDCLNPEIKVKFATVGDDVEFVLSDNGKGGSDADLGNESEGMGSKLIRSFVKQLKGHVIITNIKGTSYRIVFPIK